jgi:hypothetical protein
VPTPLSVPLRNVFENAADGSVKGALLLPDTALVPPSLAQMSQKRMIHPRIGCSTKWLAHWVHGELQQIWSH